MNLLSYCDKKNKIRQLTLSNGDASNPRGCHGNWLCWQVYAVIKERWSTRPGETICASSHRKELVYSSLSNLVEIRVVAARSDDYFMMKIEGKT